MLGQNTDLIHEISVRVDGNPLVIDEVEVVEFMFGDLQKLYPSNSVVFEDRVFKVHLTQEETQEFGRFVSVQVRVKFNNGRVPLSSKKVLPVTEALSREVL